MQGSPFFHRSKKKEASAHEKGTTPRPMDAAIHGGKHGNLFLEWECGKGASF
jgi:hypothetical protein